ncbi:MAG: DNA pilot protein [Arizlama microvirus]|nr:MAG: DNA pilot protein [Arizlama microvirus]
MSFWKKLGKGLKKVAKVALPVAGAAASFIPGMGGLGGIISKIGGALGTSSAKSASGGFQSDPGGSWDEYAPQPQQPQQRVEVTGQKPGFDWAGAIGGIAPIGAAALNYMGQKATNVANAQQAQKQMDFQADQTATAYQRGTADMKAAGLNPMLAYSQGGAASAGGAQATMGNELGAGANSALSAAQAVQQMKYVSSQMEQLSAQTNLTDAQARQSDAQTLNLAADTKNRGLQGIEQEIQNRYAEDKWRTSIRLGNSSAQLNELRKPKEETIGKAAGLIGDGLTSISSARDAAASSIGGTIADAEHDIRSWAQEKFGRKPARAR